jgi:hypothetical protein
VADPNWVEGVEVTVPAKPAHGYWTKALDYVDASKRLKFLAEHPLQGTGSPGQPAAADNRWEYAPEKHCTADGDPKAPVNPANCLLPDAPPGALIAKIGGSTAGKGDGAKLFVVGSFCVFDLDDKTKGTLYLTMNVDPMSSLVPSGQLTVTIYLR